MSQMAQKFILASASERRKLLLLDFGLDFQVIIPEVKESDFHKTVSETVAHNALLKNEWARARHPDCTIISADTALDFEGRCIGKPENLSEARKMLRMLSGKMHKVLTGLALSKKGTEPVVDVVESEVYFKKLTDSDIAKYFSLVNPLDKAGAYDIGQHPEIIIESFTGSLTNIIGLPMEKLRRMLEPEK